MIKMKQNKKGMSLADAPTLIITFLVVVVVASLAGTTLTSLQDTQTADGTAYNITGDGLTGVENFADLIPVIGVIIGIVMVLVVIFMLWSPSGGRM